MVGTPVELHYKVTQFCRFNVATDLNALYRTFSIHTSEDGKAKDMNRSLKDLEKKSRLQQGQGKTREKDKEQGLD